ncbi:MAG: hypothetical protein R6V39_05840, partial [Desulfovibrionales bacterium]
NQTKEEQKEGFPASKAPKAEDLKSLDGLVKSVGENSLTIEFQYEDTTWQSKVNTTGIKRIRRITRKNPCIPSKSHYLLTFVPL